MKNTISPRDLELLSEYLDGRLDARKRADLEARLKSNAELANTLGDLSQTRKLLRSLPKLKAPRSFRLTPEMVGRRSVPRIYPAFQFASVLASLLLVLVLAGDFLGLGTLNSAPAAAPLTALQQPVAGQSTEAYPANSVQSQPVAPAPSQSLPPAAAALAPQPTQSVSRAAALDAHLTPSPTIIEKTGAQATSEEPHVASVNPQATPPALTLEQAPPSEAAPAPLTLKASGTSVAARQPFTLSALRFGEIILALVALGTGLAAFFLRRGVGG
jgi:anti-sigma factor RsiW